MFEYLASQGLRSPYRVKRLIHQAIRSLELNLGGLIVLTEAASKNYVVTSIIAAMAGAKRVYAITTDSHYGEAKEVAEFTHKFAEFCGVRDKIEVILEKRREIVNQADIVTNLGFVRPIGRELIDMMKGAAVIPVMCEAWELREDDIDLDACREKGIPVMATNEDYAGLEVFEFSGNLCLKMLFELQIEVYQSKVTIIGSDKFGVVIEKYLRAAGASVGRFETLRDKECQKFMRNSDALIIADYGSPGVFVGINGQITANELRDLAPGICVLQFSGIVEADELRALGIPCFPCYKLGARRMGMTLADLGPKPVIDLHTAGLKVGELMAMARREEAKGKYLEDAVTADKRWAGLAVKVTNIG